jgi:DNA-binding HxlR family transcriptional regulator
MKEENEKNKEILEEEVEDIIDLDEDLNNDIVIEIDDEDLEDIIEEEIIEEIEDDIVLSKHTQEGKHRLKYDTIFKGKKDEPLDESYVVEDNSISNEGFDVDKTSSYWFESQDNESYIKEKRVKEKVYQVLSEKTDLNFLNSRRKPSKVDFNNYYYILKTNLKDEAFTNVEIFNELAVYFSDNLFNMFKLLDNKWRNLIIYELQDHVGRRKYSKEIENKNIFVGTEIEFDWIDEHGKNIKITGSVTETFYEESLYRVDSYEKIYEVDLPKITKILNNTKFKNNLNKLNNIDFL